MMLKKTTILLLLFCCTFSFSQQKVKLSAFSEISVITSGPGKNLYEKFGHTAIRVKDPILKIDLIFNYGIFNFNGADFYFDFIKGYMNYKLAYYPFHASLKRAQKDNRWVKEQVLNLTNDEKNHVFFFLMDNATPEKAGYLYDPFFNNCATKPRDIINRTLNDKIIWNDDFTSDKSLRGLMNNKIPQNTWGNLGINIALGNRLDKKATAQEYLYLPDYLHKALEKGTIKRNGKQENLIKKSTTLLDFQEPKFSPSILNPFLVFLVLLIIGSVITIKNIKTKKQRYWFDFSLLFITGCAGVLLLFLWFFTNHSTAPNNFNILWAFPFNLIVAFFMLKKNKSIWIKRYIQSLIVLLLLIPIVWIFKIQVFNWTLIPFLVLLLIRYSFIQKTLNS